METTITEGHVRIEIGTASNVLGGVLLRVSANAAIVALLIPLETRWVPSILLGANNQQIPTHRFPLGSATRNRIG